MKNTSIMFCLWLMMSALLVSGQNISFEMTSEGILQDTDTGDMEFGDIDNDGDLDLLATGKGGPIKTTLYENDGLGNFTIIPSTPFPNFFSSKVGFVDSNNDGSLDIFIMGQSSLGAIHSDLYINDGSGNFSLDTSTPFQEGAGGDFTFDDLDGDGSKDFVICGFDGSGDEFVKMYLNDGSGSFTEFGGVLPFVQLAGVVELIDMENDGDLDVLLVGSDNAGMSHCLLYANDGSANFSLVTGTPFIIVSGGDIDVGDSDNDGDEDILISGSNASFTPITKLYLNDGLGGFSDSNVFLAPSSANGESHFADFDDDGDNEIFILGSGPNGVGYPSDIVANVYENLGGNNFVLADSLIGAYLSTAAIGDIDGDNDLDIAIGGTSIGSPSRVTRLYTNKPTGEVNMRLDRTCIRVFDNPTPDTYKIEGFISDYTIDIVDGVGTIVQTLTTDFNKIIIDTNALPPGDLLLRVVNNLDNSIFGEINLKGF